MMMMVYDDGGVGGSGVVEVARGASGVVDRIDRNDGESFGLRRKNSPENILATGDGGRRRLGGGRRWPDILEGERVSGKTEKLSGMSFHIEFALGSEL
ncbi:hypothetical protein Tco_1305702 [Tanacetum coccineum]